MWMLYGGACDVPLSFLHCERIATVLTSLLKDHACQQARLLTPVQRDVLLVAAMPQIFDWPERWIAPSVRQDAIAWGLVRRGLLREFPLIPGGYETTVLGTLTARMMLEAEEPLDVALSTLATD